MRAGQVSFRTAALSSNRSRSRRALRIGRISIGTGRPASSDASERALDDMIFELARILFADGPAARRLAGFVHGLAASRHEVVPLGQRLAGGAKAVGAGLRKPVQA